MVQHRGKTFPHWKAGKSSVSIAHPCICMYACLYMSTWQCLACYMFFLYAYCLQNKADSILEGVLRPTLSCYGSVTYHINCAYAHSSIYWWALLPFGKLKECAPCFASFRQLERVCAFPPIPDSSIPVFPLVPHGPPPPIPDSSTPHVPVSLP